MTGVDVQVLTGRHGGIGVLTLNQPKALNALSTDMIRVMHAQLLAWRDDASIQAVWIEGAGDKAFCAGGDVVMLYHSMIDTADGQLPQQALEFFQCEYRMDYAIHTYPKPVVVWADGIVMGGGIGVAIGGSHRVVTERSMLAMPEVTIGLYPDVGASWFFNRMPVQLAEFLGMTGYRMDAADALFTQMADYAVNSGDRRRVLDGLLALQFVNPHNEIDALLSEHAASIQIQSSTLHQNLDQIHALTGPRDLPAVVRHFETLQSDEKWLQRAARALLSGCPMTLALVREQIRRARHMSLAEVFQMELIVSTQCAMHADFREGVRALLIDKDGQPNWSQSDVAAIDGALLNEYFTAPWSGEHPLGDLS